MPSRARWPAVLGLCVATLAAPDTGAEPLATWFRVEGSVGAKTVAGTLLLRDRDVTGSYGYAFHRGELSLTGALAASAPSDGRVSCAFEERDPSHQPARPTGTFHGTCDFSRLAGEVDFVFEGTWRDPKGTRVAPVRLTTGRARALAALARYGSFLPPLASTLAPPQGCRGEPRIYGVARDGATSLVLWAQRFSCAVADTEPHYPAFNAYVAALSLFDDGAAAPRLVATLPLSHPQDDAADVVEWDGNLVPFRLAPGVLGAIATVGGTISGSGLLSASQAHVIAVTKARELRALRSFEASSFGKSGMDNSATSSSEIVQVELDGAAPPELVFASSSSVVTDGVARDTREAPEAYRFVVRDSKLVRLKRHVGLHTLSRGRPISGSASSAKRRNSQPRRQPGAAAYRSPSAPCSNRRTSTSRRSTRPRKNGTPAPSALGWTNSAYSSTSPCCCSAATSCEPP